MLPRRTHPRSDPSGRFSVAPSLTGWLPARTAPSTSPERHRQSPGLRDRGFALRGLEQIADREVDLLTRAVDPGRGSVPLLWTSGFTSARWATYL